MGSASGAGERPRGLSAVEGGRVVTDPALVPEVLRESPAFAERVARGKLPPVAARVGRDPLVIRPVHGVGRYGGTLRRGSSAPRTG